MRVCIDCGNEQEDGNFCKNCGASTFERTNASYSEKDTPQQPASKVSQNIDHEKAKRDELNKARAKKGVIGCFGLIIILIIIGIIVGVSSEDLDDGETDKATTTSNFENQIEEIVKDELGKGNRDVDKISKIDVLGSKTDGYIVNIHFALDDNLSGDYIKKGALMDVYDVLGQLYQSDIPIKSVFFLGTFSMKDKYGNVSESMVMKYELDRETANKINWSNFSYNDLPDVAVSQYWHSSL